MSAYVLVDIEVTEPVQYEAYKKLAADTVAAFDGRYVARGSGGTRAPTGPPGACGRPRPART